jgi:hypothetical protein
LWTSHSGVCRHVYGHIFSAAWILIHRWTRLASSFVGPSPLLCCTIEPLQVDADVSVLRQSKDVWCVQLSRFHVDGFWLCTDIRRRPGTFNVVSLAVTVRFLRWSTRM